MKAILRSILVVMVLALVLTAFTGCDLIDKIKEILNGDVCEHEIVTDEAVEATCTSKGLTEGYHCSKCGKIIMEQYEVAMTSHKKEVIPGVKPTCTEGGISDGEKCSVCNTVLKEQKALEALGHNGGQATCQAPAVCETCEQPYGEIGSHVEEIVAGKAATCTEAGLTDGKKCSVCGETTLAQEVITALGHTKEVLPAKEATCTETGLTAGEKCTVCNEVLVAQTELSKLPHTYLDDNDTTCEKCDYVRDCKHLEKVTVPGKAATCTEAGLTDGEKCKHCGDILKAQEEIPAKGHKEEVLAGKAATCTEAGLTEGKKCSVCNTILTAQTEIPAKGHTEVADAGKDATCLEAGLTAGKHCSVCKAVLVKQEEIPAKGHTEQVLPGKAATCLETGLTEGKKCFVCGDVLVAQEEIALADHTWVDATAEAPKHCSVCDRAVIVVYYNNVNNWSEIYFYAWDGTSTPVTPAWPGAPMTAVEGAEGWYKIEYEIAKYDALYIIFTEGMNKPQTADLTYSPAAIYWVGETAYATWGEANAVTMSGKIDAEHYLDMLPSLSVSVVDGDKTYTGSITGDTWSIKVPEDLCDFTVVIHDEQGRFYDIEMMYAMVDTNARPAEKLVPVMAKYDVWTDHNGAHVPDQNKLVLNSDGSYSLIKTESGAALSNSDWWASGVATGAYFVGAQSEYWVMEFDMTLLGAGGYNQWHAGLMVDDKEFIMVMDRDWQLAAWTEWNLGANAAGSWTDLITYDKAAAAGIVDSQNWAPEGRPMKITAVRDNKTLHIFLNGVYVSKVDISDTLLPNSNRGASNKIGFMVKSGTEAKINNYWYELGAENVAAYLASKQGASVPTFSVIDSNGNAVEGGSVQYYKEVLIRTESGYKEVTEWQLATEADFVEGMRLKAVLSGVDATGARINGNYVNCSNNECVFTLGKNDSIEFFSGFYYVVGADKGRVDFNDSANIPSGDVFIVTKVQIPAEQLNALLSAKGESVIGIEMRADGRAVENMLWINGGDIKLLSGDWSEAGKLMSNGALNEYGQALAGDGLYFGMQYVASSGLTYTWLGTTPYNLVRIRDWGTGGADNPGYRSFDANAKITGYSFGYVHCWTGNDANLRADVKFSDVYVGSKKPVEPATLIEANKATRVQLSSGTIDGVGHQLASGSMLSYDSAKDAAKYTFPTITTNATKPYGKGIIAFFGGLSFTDISEYSTVTFKMYIDPATAPEGFEFIIRAYNSSKAEKKYVKAGEWVELTFNISDFTHGYSGGLKAIDKANLVNLGFSFVVSDMENMTMLAGFTMYFTDFIVK